jgi:bla regulator protein BlaR1
MDVLPLCAAALMRATISTFPLFVLVAAITLLGRRWLAPWSRQMLWSLVLVRLMLPISFESPWSLQPSIAKDIELSVSPAEDHEQNRVVQVLTLDFLSFGEPDLNDAKLPYGHPRTNRPSPTPVAMGNAGERLFQYILPAGLLVGMFVVGIWTIVTSVRLWNWTRSGTPCDREDLRSLVMEGQRRLGVSGTVRLWKVPGLVCPATYGWWNPTILLPQDIDTWSLQELRHVLWHELAHIRRYDVLLNWGLALVRIVHWWNPMFWMAQRAWLVERELACDTLVLAQLEEDGARRYGETLLKFIEQLAAMSSRPSLAAPGFVSFWGRKREAKRRLSELPKLARPERTWCVWFSMALIVLLTIVGLTDGATVARNTIQPAPLELPADTLWDMTSVQNIDNSERSTVEYALGPAIERQCRDGRASRDMIFLSMHHMLGAVNGLHGPIASESIAGDSQKFWSCTVGRNLIAIHGTAAEHTEVKRLLELWRTSDLTNVHGELAQIYTELRIATTSTSLAELLPDVKGKVVSGAEPEVDTLSAAAHAKSISSGPLFQALLTEPEMRALMWRLSEKGGNLTFAPKLTTYSGQTAKIVSLVRQPFLTGLRQHGGGVHEPLISIADAGFTIQTRATAVPAAEAIQFEVAFQESRVEEVELWNTKWDGHPTAVQLPRVARSVVSVTENVPSGHTLLLVPLRRNEKGQLQLHLFRSELIPQEAHADEAPSEE